MTDPTTPSGEPKPPVPELAPPLVGPPAPPITAPGVPPAPGAPYRTPPGAPSIPLYAPPYAPSVPPYAQQPYTAPGPYPAGQVPAPAGRSRAPLALLLSGIVFVLILIAVSIGAILLITQGTGGTSAPVRSPLPSVRPEPAPTSAPDPRPSAEPSAGPSAGPGSSHVADVEAMLADKITAYKQSSQDGGSLWQQIPDDEHNRVAVQAFLYILTDMHAAFLWGVDEPTAQKFKTDAEDVERKLLAQQPLGTDIKITGKNGTFTYNGDTGEGGWS